MTIREIFEQACTLDAGRRADYLRRVCQDQAQITQVSRMLDLIDANGDFLQTPVLDEPTRDAILSSADEPMPARIGRYRIVARLGAGGMGTIYEAAQESPDRHVALKLIHADLSGRQARERFALEADVLGRLHHPGIAQIYEADVADIDGARRPFIAMELIEGAHIDDHAAALDVRIRLDLIAHVADAVHHAHMRGVIHRDLKAFKHPRGRRWPPGPGHRLRRRANHRSRCRGGHACRPDRRPARRHASSLHVAPSSCEAPASTTSTSRCDVYALGALAYQLIAGTPAHDLRGVGLIEAARIIRERAPARLRDVDPAIDPDVDTIVRTAMAPDRDRRYASAAAMAADIRRCLEHRPIEARPPTLRYQASRWARRHRALAVTASVAVVTILLATIGTTTALIWVVQERREADARAADAETALAFLQRMLTSAEPAALGRDARVIEVLAAATSTLDEGLDDQPLLEARLRHMIAETYQALGEHDVAEAHLRRALALRDAALGADAPDTLDSRHALAYSLVRRSHYDEAEPLIRDVLDTRARTLGERDVKTLESMHVLGLLLNFDGRYEAALRVLGDLQSLSTSALGPDHELTMTADNCMANLQHHLGHAEQARDLHARTLDRRTGVLGREHPDTLQSLNNLGGVYADLGQLDRAERILEEAADVSDRVRGPLHPATLTTKANLAVVLRRLNRTDDARTLLDQVLSDRETVLGPHHSETIIAMGNLASIHVQQGDHQQASTLLDGAISRSIDAGLAEHPTTGRLLLMHARVLDVLGQRADAIIAVDAAEAILVPALGDAGRSICDAARAEIQ